MTSSLETLLSHLELRTSKLIDLNLERVLQLKDRLSINPRFKIITVAGTNGKGSICFYLNEFLLKKNNLNVGLYTSPHFFKFNERIKINGNDVTDQELVDAINLILKNDKDQHLTYFEITTLAAIIIFEKYKIDIAILEVGLGGRLDAVNAFDSNISIISSIGMDHTEYLGNTINKIAYEKSGVMRPEKICIIGEEINNLALIEAADKVKAKAFIYNKDFSYKSITKIFNKKTSNHHNILNKDEISKKNLSCAVFALQELGFNYEYEDFIDVANKIFFGRFNVIAEYPEVIIDVAHNEDSLKNLVIKINKLPKKRTRFIFSILKDKNFKDLVSIFNTLDNDFDWFIAPLNTDRAEGVNTINSALTKSGHKAIYQFNSINEAYKQAYKASGKDDRIIVFGSFYVISEVFKGQDYVNK